ncbi:Cryptochrome-1 [Exaiptasia diaphana]|nr:Cryptochrome-1 [Exaiptasia diaphana]
MVHNPLCLQVEWRDDGRVEEDLERWAKGQTGFPWIDAVMAQVRQEGWIHPLARYAAASFLTRGDLWISWERGVNLPFLNLLKRKVPPISLYGQLLWREFFYCVSTNNPNFDKMVHNPLCLQVEWRDDGRVEEDLERWAKGQTGFPWIDAVMAQVRQEGWIHPLARYAAASFLTRGDLWISWERGVKVFEEFLLDADWSINAGNWMWHSCSAFSQHFFYPQCPIGFGKRLDANGDYIRI